MNDKQATADKQTMAVLLAEGFAFAVQVGLISGAAIVAALGKFLLALLLLGLAWGWPGASCGGARRKSQSLIFFFFKERCHGV